MNLDSKGFFTRGALLGLAGLTLLLAACAPRIYTEQDQDAKLAGYHRFAWATPPAGPVRDPILDSQILEARGENLKLVPGMQVVAEIAQGRRTVMEYLLSPVQKTLHDSGRER